MKMMYFILLMIFSLFSPLMARPPLEVTPGIVVNNRILITINGRNLSLLDVTKEMDVFLSQYYPQYLESPPARLQFYTTQWKATLQRMIDQELMMADAESREVKTTDAEVREEIQNRYGPNIITSLDKLGISYEEAHEMIHRELVVQKIQWLRVTSKAFSKVTTQVVKKAYEDYLQKNPPRETWTYQFLTFRYPSTETALCDADQVKTLETCCKRSLLAAAEQFKEKLPESEKSGLTVSAEFQSNHQELSPAHREILKQLSPDSWSRPIVQQSRDGSEVVRIFHLKSHTKQEAPAFAALATELRQELLNQYADAEMQRYLARLHERFGYHEASLDIPPRFEPFSF